MVLVIMVDTKGGTRETTHLALCPNLPEDGCTLIICLLETELIMLSDSLGVSLLQPV